jgi:hypothetical protein
MKDKNNYARNKNILQTQRSLCAFTKNRNDPKAKAHYIQYCKTLRKVIKLNSNITVRLTAKSNNTMTTTWNILKKETREVHSVEQIPIRGCNRHGQCLQ